MENKLITKGNPVSGNIYSSLQSIAIEYPERILITVGKDSISGAEFLRESQRISDALYSAGVAPGTKVAMILPNSVQWYCTFWSTVKIGGIPVPLDPQAGEWEMVQLLNHAECTFCFAASHYRANKILNNLKNAASQIPLLKLFIYTGEIDNLDNTRFVSYKDFLNRTLYSSKESPVYLPDGEDTLMLACTSGSTGNPKIIAVPHEGFLKSQKDMAVYLGFCSTDVMLLGMPLYHQGGFGMGLQMALSGGAVLYQPQFDPTLFLNLIEQHKVTIIQLTATLAKILLTVPDFDSYDISSVRIVYFAGEKLPMEIAKEFYEYRGIRVINVIGSTETATMVIWDSLYDTAVDVNDFRALAFTDFKIMNENMIEAHKGETGLIFVNTDALLQCYYSNKDETSRKIIYIDNKWWFNTGDLGIRLADNRVRFIGRAKRIIKRGANLVCPEENESFLLTHPQIAAVAVTGEFHELFGEMIVAYIQPKAGYKLDRGNIVSFCQGKLAVYKIPDKVIIVDVIPHDIGKIQFKYLK